MKEDNVSVYAFQLAASMLDTEITENKNKTKQTEKFWIDKFKVYYDGFKKVLE